MMISAGFVAALLISSMNSSRSNAFRSCAALRITGEEEEPIFRQLLKL